MFTLRLKSFLDAVVSVDSNASGTFRLLSFKSLWVLVGFLPDGDFTIRLASPMAGGIQLWANAQLNDAMARMVRAASTRYLVKRLGQLEDQILLANQAAEAGKWSFHRARCHEVELREQILSMQGELQLRDGLALQRT